MYWIHVIIYLCVDSQDHLHVNNMLKFISKRVMSKEQTDFCRNSKNYVQIQQSSLHFSTSIMSKYLIKIIH
jgi:hypothetical protein